MVFASPNHSIVFACAALYLGVVFAHIACAALYLGVVFASECNHSEWIPPFPVSSLDWRCRRSMGLWFTLQENENEWTYFKVVDIYIQ